MVAQPEVAKVAHGTLSPDTEQNKWDLSVHNPAHSTKWWGLLGSIHSIGCFGITMAWITNCFDLYFMIFIFWLVSMSSYVLIYINRKLYIQLYSCVFMCVCLHWPSPIKWLVHVGTVPISMASLRGFRGSLIFSCGGFRRRRSWCSSLGNDNEAPTRSNPLYKMVGPMVGPVGGQNDWDRLRLCLCSSIL